MTSQNLWRALPDLPEILERINRGEYDIHGGVVRHAAGTGRGGQIVAHLKFPTDAHKAQESIQKLQSMMQEGLGSLQGGVNQLQSSVNVLQGLQVANLALSGLNLAVSVAGFVVVCKKLDGISAQISAQSRGIEQTLGMVSEARERSLLTDEASFRALTLSSRQYCEQGEIGHLRALLPDFHKQYEFTKLVLQRLALLPASNIDRLGEISLLQDRLVNLGMLLSHVQMKIGAPEHGQECLHDLATNIVSLNRQRVDVLTRDKEIAFQINKEQLTDVVSLLNRGKQVVPALTYEADLMGLEILRPGALLQAPETTEILLLAA